MTLRIYRGDRSSPRTAKAASRRILTKSGDIRVGARLDRYRVTGRIGEGGFATVYSAIDTRDRSSVALKIPDASWLDDETVAEDLQREVKILGEMDHPGIVPLRDARVICDQFVMVFPMGDESLASRLTRRISRATAMDYAIQMVAAVAYAHANEILHRDIKPDNFIVFPEQTVRLTDFGLARVENVLHDVSASGTLGYIAPEQAMGHPSYRTDVFSLGLVLYHMFSGEIPEYPFRTLPGFNRFRRGLSNEFVAVVRKALDMTASRRFRDAVAMHNALLRIKYPLTDRRVTFRAA